MMPTLVVMATAVVRAAVRTDVRPKEARKERRASMASVPSTIWIQGAAKREKSVTTVGMAADVPAMSRRTEA